MSERATGLIPRDFKAYPPGYLAFAPQLPDDLLIPENEWEDRLREQKANKASLLDLRETHYDTLKSLDQNGFGLCWAFSTTKAVMYLRAMNNQNPLILSAWYVAGMINGWADRGGWGSASLEFIVKNGIPTIDKCPQYKRNSVTSDADENAALHKVSEWWDGSDDRDLARKQLVSCLLRGWPCVTDFNHISHSMVTVGLESVNPLVTYADNSWNEINDFGPKGLYKLTGAKAVPDGMVIPRVIAATDT